MPSTVRLDIPVLLPEAPDALDACVERLVKRLTGAPGLSQIHVAESPTGPQLCLHYDAKLLSPDEVRRKALQAGVEISRRFGHLVGWTQGVRHARHARSLEADLKAEPGLLEVGLDAAGAVRVEFDQNRITRDQLIKTLAGHGLTFSPSPSRPGLNTPQTTTPATTTIPGRRITPTMITPTEGFSAPTPN
ncbi:hypothetical protein [Brevundimonas mediterranea]|uniref:hypothetical protein n=1 Tax=Brevundimonas mediterranea TaxID=74329 RepID=UPI0040338D83